MGLLDKFRGRKTDKTNNGAGGLPQEVQDEIKEALFFTVYSGLYSPASIMEQALQTIEDICEYNSTPCPTEDYAREMVQAMDKAAKPVAGKRNYERLQTVFDTLNQERIIAVHNAGYTLDDGFAEVGVVFQFMKDNNIPRRGYCFYHQQDIERVMNTNSGNLLLAFHSMNGDEKLALEVGERIVELLTKQGFSVKWNHSLDQRIEIENFEWDKVYNGENYGPDRAIRIMRAQ